MSSDSAVVSARGAARWTRGHPWIFRSDLIQSPSLPAGAVRVEDNRGRPIGVALWSPKSEISLRFVSRDPNATLDQHWWNEAIARAVTHRHDTLRETNACRLIHGEGDALPSLVCDRYDRWLVVQLLSAGLESFRDVIVSALHEATECEGILARNDTAVREREGLTRETALLFGEVPQEIEVNEHGVRYLAAPWTGQKTGAFLDQRENRRLIGTLARGRALDCFAYHGSFSLHMAGRADSVTALDSSADALARAQENAQRNGYQNISFLQGDAFEALRTFERSDDRFDTIVVDPPAFAKSRSAIGAAMRGYHEVNLRAMRLLAPGGVMLTASCSHHVDRGRFFEMLAAAAADSGRRLVLRNIVGQPSDHPELLTVPESGYLKGAVLEAAV
ncbi:MAG: class I SAM-dependent rRNA methyltransferase [Gemmatimonadaceae bacterium]